MSGRLESRRPTLGVLVDELSNDYTMTVLNALHAAARVRDIDLICFAGGDFLSSDLRRRARNMAFKLPGRDNVDGVLVLQIGAHASPEQLAEVLDSVGLPACSIGVRCPGYPCVQLDNDSAARKLVAHAVTVHKRRRILFVRGPAENREVERRFEVYRDTLDEFDIPFDDELVIESEFPVFAAQEAMRRHVVARGVNFDAVIAATDHMALGVLAALTQASVRVPEDVTLMGFDDIDEAWSSIPPLTTVRQPWHEQAEVAIDKVLAQLAGEQVESVRKVHAELVTRRSCGCFEALVAEAGDLSGVAEEEGQREQAVASLQRAWPQVSVGDAHRWVDQLLRDLEQDAGDAGHRLTGNLERISRELVAAGNRLRALQAVLTQLRSCALPGYLVGMELALRCESVLHQARILVAGAAERQEANRRLESERLTRVLAQTARALITSFDVESLPVALSRELPELGIGAAYLSLYVGEGEPPTTSRLMLAYDEARMGTMEHTSKVLTRKLLPQRLFPAARRFTLILMPLCFEDDQLGYLLLELGPSHGAVYEALREMLCASLKGARLVRDLAEAAAQREKAERERLAKELEIATRIQTSILPRDFSVPGLEVAAVMRPAAEVGGDYYDVLPTSDGAWLGIGDVAGHGLRPGLVMMMLQSIVAALANYAPDAQPRALLQVVNRVLYHNVRERLQQDEHATLSLLRYQSSGRLTMAGAHEAILIWRSATGTVETVETPGTWVAATKDIEAATVQTELELAEGDVMLLYTDGVIEAQDAHRTAYGIERLAQRLKAMAHEPARVIARGLLDDVRRFIAEQRDDIALFVARQVGV